MNTIIDSLAHELPYEKALSICKEASQELIRYYLSVSCPCAFPRFQFLVSFNGNNYSQGLLHTIDTNVIVSSSLDESLHFLQKDSDSDKYTCKVCGTKYNYIYEQFGINFELLRLISDNIKTPIKGAEIEFPFHLYTGIYLVNGIKSDQENKKEYDQLTKKFPAVRLHAFIEFMKKLQSNIPITE